ncbi:Toxin HigB-2 [Caulobacteraceae bacterium]
MRVYINAWFAKFARQEGIEDFQLVEAVVRANIGLIDADLGAGVIKQRISRQGAGKSGGFRTIIFFKARNRAIFMFGFAKKAKKNLTREELLEMKRASREMLQLSQDQIDHLVRLKKLQEIRFGH